VRGPRTYSPPCADRRLLATPASRSRVADCDPNHEQVFEIAPPRGLAAHCPAHCSVCVAQGIKATPTGRHPHLPPPFRGSLAREPVSRQLTTRVLPVLGVNPTPHGTS